MPLDGSNRQQHVKVHEDDKKLAVRVARTVRTELLRAGIEVKDCIVPALGGSPGQEHDLVLEVVDCLDEGLVLKKISGELKMRRLRSGNGKDIVRDAFAKECVAESKWWQAEARTGRWSGRLVILANFPEGRGNDSKCEILADFYPIGGRRQGIIGWPYSKRTFVCRPLPAPAATMKRPILKGPAPKMPPPPPPRKVKKPFPKLKMRPWKGRMVGPVKPVLEAALKDHDHIDRKYLRWARSVPDGFADKAPREGGKPGGKPEYVATNAVLQYIYDSA